MTETRKFGPDKKLYTIRCWIDASIPLLLGGAFLMFISVLVGATERTLIPAMIFLPIIPAAWIAVLLYIPAWVKNVSFEMTDEEIIVHKGVFSHIHKIVPYRTVTNVTIRRGFLDRIWLGLGTVNVQTAGSGATSVAEERLVGLKEYEAIRDAIVENLRRYRADTGPALGGGVAVGKPAGTSEKPVNGEVAQAMLEELKSIRELLEKTQ